MSPCTSDSITPKMIKSGHMKIGDRIYIEESHPGDRLVSGPEPMESEPTMNVTMETAAEVHPNEIPVAAQAGLWPTQMSPQSQHQHQNQNWGNTWNPNRQMSQPLVFDEMTPYLDNITITGETPSPTVSLPQSPMTTSEFTETIGLTDVQAYTGFLRTQIGRFMRIEQLIGSNVIEDRYGYLVGVGTNFVVLQEMFTGNIMIIDLFSIKLTYIYFTDAPAIPANR